MGISNFSTQKPLHLNADDSISNLHSPKFRRFGTHAPQLSSHNLMAHATTNSAQTHLQTQAGQIDGSQSEAIITRKMEYFEKFYQENFVLQSEENLSW
jgi:hypothetical protein